MALLVYSIAFAAFGDGGGSIAGFNLNSCTMDHCLHITAPKAYISQIDSTIAMSKAHISIYKQKKSKKTSSLASTDSVLDMQHNTFYIYQIEGHPHQQAYYDLATGHLHYLRSR